MLIIILLHRIGTLEEPAPGRGIMVGIADCAALGAAIGQKRADKRLIGGGRQAEAAHCGLRRRSRTTFIQLDSVSRLGSHGVVRSEEHTSELPSLMRISYAVY